MEDTMSKTLFDKVWDSHVVKHIDNGPDVLFIDRHLVHEVTSPVAFLGLKNRGIKVLYPERTFATADHNTPTRNQHLPVKDPLSANQLRALEENANAHNIPYWGLGHEKNGKGAHLGKTWMATELKDCGHEIPSPQDEGSEDDEISHHR